MKKTATILVFMFCAIIALAQTKTATNANKQNEEAELNKKYDNCQMALWNGTTSTMTLSSTSVSDSTDKKTLSLEVSESGIKCKDYTIKLGMTKEQVSQTAKKMGLSLTKKTSKYWLISNSGVIMKFQNGKLAEMPGICLDFELMY
jgi:phage protein D